MKLTELAKTLGLELVNFHTEIDINGVATLQNAKSGDLTFLTNSKYAKFLSESQASACIIESKDLPSDAPRQIVFLISKNAHESYARALQLLYPETQIEEYIAPSANIASSARIGKSCYIGHNVIIGDEVEIDDNVYIESGSVIGDGCSIGNGTIVKSNVTIENTTIGAKCYIHSGARIGQDGFGFAPSATGIIKVKQLGRVVIEDQVEIGANTCIDRGAIEDTRIGFGTKIDNLVQIGHNCIIGKFCFICGQVGLAGSTTVEDGVMLGGQVGVAGHLRIGAGTKVAAQSGIINDVEPKSILGGSPAMPIKDWHKASIMIRKMIGRSKKQEN